MRERSKTWCFWRRIWIISAAEQSTEDPWALSEIAKQHTRNVSDPRQLNWETFWFWEKMPYLNILRGTLLPRFWDSKCCSCFFKGRLQGQEFCLLTWIKEHRGHPQTLENCGMALNRVRMLKVCYLKKKKKGPGGPCCPLTTTCSVLDPRFPAAGEPPTSPPPVKWVKIITYLNLGVSLLCYTEIHLLSSESLKLKRDLSY